MSAYDPEKPKELETLEQSAVDLMSLSMSSDREPLYVDPETDATIPYPADATAEKFAIWYGRRMINRVARHLVLQFRNEASELEIDRDRLAEQYDLDPAEAVDVEALCRMAEAMTRNSMASTDVIKEAIEAVQTEVDELFDPGDLMAVIPAKSRINDRVADLFLNLTHAYSRQVVTEGGE